MAAQRPWLLIDVDGVLNPLVVADGFEIHELTPLGWTRPPLQVQLTPRHGEWINAMTDVFDLAWATTWEESANLMIGPIVGIPELPVVPFDFDMARRVWGICMKTPDVAEWVGDRPFAWLDDMISDLDANWLREHADVGQFHLQSIDPLTGLTEADLAEVRAWGESL
jgi:hypothetical protein